MVRQGLPINLNCVLFRNYNISMTKFSILILGKSAHLELMSEFAVYETVPSISRFGHSIDYKQDRRDQNFITITTNGTYLLLLTPIVS